MFPKKYYNFLMMNLLLLLMVPIITLITGYLMYRHTPKSINGLVGYRTSRSMINQDTWDFANKYCASLWIKLGIITSVISFLIYILFDVNETVSIVIVLIQTFLLLFSIIPVEKALKNTFDENGNRRV